MINDLKNEIKNFNENLKSLDLNFIDQTYKMRGDIGDLRSFKSEIQNIKDILSLFTEIDTEKLLPVSQQEITQLFVNFKDLINWIRNNYLKKADLSKAQAVEKILHIERFAGEVLSKHQHKLSKNIIETATKITRDKDIKRNIDKSKDISFQLKQKVDDQANKLFSEDISVNFNDQSALHGESRKKWFEALLSCGIAIIVAAIIIACKEIENPYFIIPIFSVLGSLFVLFYILFKNDREKTIDQKENALLLNHLDDFLFSKEPSERLVIINTIFARFKKDKKQDINSDLIKILSDRLKILEK